MIEIAQIASYTAPAVVVIGGLRWLISIIWRRGERVLDDIREEGKQRQDSIDTKLVDIRNEGKTQRDSIETKLDRIEGQTTTTNGRVTTLENRMEKVETTAAILHDVVVAAIKKAEV